VIRSHAAATTATTIIRHDITDANGELFA